MLDEHMGPIKKYSILTVGAVVLALANTVSILNFLIGPICSSNIIFSPFLP